MAGYFRLTICTKAGGIIFIGMQNLKHKLFAYFSALMFVVAMPLQAQTHAQSNACGADGVSLDHVIWAVPDLEGYAKRFTKLTGIKPVYGGEHTNGVTANYLVSLGPCTYLEIVGPKKGAAVADLGDQAKSYAREHVAGFAFSTDLNAPPKALQALGLGERREGGRVKPDGSQLSWQTAALSGLNFGDDKFQFVINWLSQPHPAVTSAKGAVIVQLTIAHPDSVKLRDLVEANMLPIVLQPAGKPNIWLTISTPNGSVTLR